MIKLTKNLVTVVSSLSTRYWIKKIYVNIRTDVTPPPPVRICSHFDGAPDPNECERNDWMHLYENKPRHGCFQLGLLKNNLFKVNCKVSKVDFLCLVSSVVVNACKTTVKQKQCTAQLQSQNTETWLQTKKSLYIGLQEMKMIIARPDAVTLSWPILGQRSAEVWGFLRFGSHIINWLVFLWLAGLRGT